MFLIIVQPLAQGARDDCNRKLYNNSLPNGNDLTFSYIPLYAISEEYSVGKKFPLKHEACQMKQLLSVKIQSGNTHTNLFSNSLRKGFNTVLKYAPQSLLCKHWIEYVSPYQREKSIFKIPPVNKMKVPKENCTMKDRVCYPFKSKAKQPINSLLTCFFP